MEEGANQSEWQYHPGDQQSEQAHPDIPRGLEVVSWTASEYVAHDKSSGWFIRYGLASFAVLAIIFLVTDDVISVVLLAIAAIAFGVFAGRRPAVLKYRIDTQGIHIGPKLYPASLFRSFAIVQEGAIRSLLLLPLKRFMPSITVYFAPEDEPKIVGALGSFLPYEDRQQDPLDRFMHRIRF